MKQLVVTGASGFVGGYLLPFLREQGYQVRALVRSEAAAAKVAALGAEAVLCRMDSRASLADAVEGADAVVHMAARLDFYGPYGLFHEDNVLLTERLLEASRASGVGLFVHVGAAAVAIGSSAAFPLDETAPLPSWPAGAYGRSKAVAERLVLEAPGELPRRIVLRPPLVWAADAPVFDAIATAVAKRQFVWIDAGRYTVATIHVENLVAAIHAALSSSGVSGAFFVSDGEAIAFRRLVSAALRSRCISPPRLSLPRWLARVGAFCSEWLWLLCRLPGRPPITTTLVALIGGEFRIDDSRARELLGYANRISVAQGLAAFQYYQPGR